MAIQNLEQFQSAFGTTPVEIKLEQFGKDAAFYLKPLTSVERDGFEASVVGVEGKRNLHNLRAKLVASCLCDKDGKLLGTAKQIGDLRANVIGALFEQVRHLNGMDADDVDDAGKD